MKKKRYTEEQIYKILKETDSGIPVQDLCRKHGIHQNTLYRWKSKYGGMELSDIKKMKQLEHENTELKKILAEKELELRAMKMIVEKKW
ncbi:MAG: transposase [Spirochaetia bacterium]|nr:transposase [Spirochaetia bacterium]